MPRKSIEGTTIELIGKNKFVA